jgi:hypothetical protein
MTTNATSITVTTSDPELIALIAAAMCPSDRIAATEPDELRDLHEILAYERRTASSLREQIAELRSMLNGARNASDSVIDLLRKDLELSRSATLAAAGPSVTDVRISVARTALCDAAQRWESLLRPERHRVAPGSPTGQALEDVRQEAIFSPATGDLLAACDTFAVTMAEISNDEMPF